MARLKQVRREQSKKKERVQRARGLFNSGGGGLASLEARYEKEILLWRL